jgi:Uma2 family endonuclease
MATHVSPVEDGSVQGFVSEEEYLRTSYRPDCDYVEGRIEERNVGEYEHAVVQKMLLRLIGNREAEWRVNVIQECRLQVSDQRYRVPDVMVLRAEQKVHRIVREAPPLCIEVLSAEDTWKRLRGVMEDYLAMGVAHVWAFDPEERRAYRFDADGFHPVTAEALTVEGTEIRVVIAEVFSLLD